MSQVFSSLATIFLLMIPGLIFGKRELVTDSQVRGMSKFLMDVVLPVLLIDSMQVELEEGFLLASLKITASILIIFLCSVGTGYILCRLLKMPQNDFGLLSFCLFFANTGGIGIPVVAMLLGREALLYASIAEIAVDVLIFTCGIMLIRISGKQTGEGTAIDFRKLLSPGLVGIVIGLVLLLFHIRLPAVIAAACGKLGGANFPIAMFIIGYNLGRIKFRDVLDDCRIYIAVAVKMLAMPAAAYLICMLCRLDFITGGVVTIMMAMPTGSAAVIFAQEYEADHAYASKFVMLTTMASILTLVPLNAFFLAGN